MLLVCLLLYLLYKFVCGKFKDNLEFPGEGSCTQRFYKNM